MTDDLYLYESDGKVVEVTARKWDGSKEQADEIVKWISDKGFKVKHFEKGSFDFDLHLELIDIETAKGDVGMQVGWWVILGKDETFYIESPIVFDIQYKQKTEG